VTFYRRRLPHLQRDNKPHFVTFCTWQRWQLPETARKIVMNSCLHDNGTRYDLRVAVVMPDHVRMIMVPRVDEKEQRMWTMPEILDAVKGASAHLINKALGRRGLVWQQESFDHVLRSSESLDAKIQFVLDNPVRRGLVANSGEYPWLWHREQESPYRPDKLA
jgi:hypothetical protein